MDWSHQTYAVEQTRKAIEAGERRLCLTSPTGSGKTRIVERIIEWGRPSIVLCNRTMLLEQWARGLDDGGKPFGMRASGYAPSIFENVQLGMVQTIAKRWGDGEDLPEAEIVILDEAHNETGARVCAILDEYTKRGATVILVTATPIGIGHMADKLIVASTTGRLIKQGVLVPAFTYAPDEPDARALKATTKGVIQFREEVKEVMLRVVFGRVLEHYHRLNPMQTPSILFAPGVDESLWFCEQFNEAGIPWSHIDAQRIVLNGCDLPATKDNRERLAEASRTGETRGVSNRFVLREGVDWPWLQHGIFACTFGSVASYLQAGGRLLRQYFVDGAPQLEGVTVQDHGGCFWRHDSLNADREWLLTDTDKSLQEKHDEIYRTKAEPEPIVCPKCSKVRSRGAHCPACGFAHQGRRRIVVQTDGQLREVRGDVYKERRVSTDPDAHKKWKQCYYRCKNSGKTFNQARALFQRENYGAVPGPDFPLVPLSKTDWNLPVGDVPYSRLVGSA